MLTYLLVLDKMSQAALSTIVRIDYFLAKPIAQHENKNCTKIQQGAHLLRWVSAHTPVKLLTPGSKSTNHKSRQLKVLT